MPLVRSLSASLDPSRYNLILVDSRPFQIFLIAAIRMTVSEEDHLEDSALIPFDKVFQNGNGTFVQGTVTAINAREKDSNVALEDGSTIPYDVLVLSPGSLWPGPLAFPTDPQKVSAFVRESRTKFQTAKHVVLAGGGSVAIGARQSTKTSDSVLTPSFYRVFWRD
jgi:apoptosis-inducing factor 2